MRRILSVFIIGTVFSMAASLLPVRAQDGAVDIPLDHPEMKAAIAKARRALPTFWRKFENPEPHEIAFSLRVVFKDGEESEPLWVLDIERDGETIRATVGGEPQRLTNLTYGDRVTFTEAEIIDWCYNTKGKLVGYETIRPLLGRMPAEQARAWQKLFEYP